MGIFRRPYGGASRQAAGRADPFALPEALAALLARVHGDDALARFEIPADYARFLRRSGGGGLRAAPGRDGRAVPYGRRVHRWPQVLAATTGMYEALLPVEDDHVPEDEREDALNSVQKVGVWLEIGSHGDRHLHFLCCDRSRAAFGQVHDANDGDPTTGLVPDRVWESFRAYLR